MLLDAFLLRTILVPALMHLAGHANWWLPGWLDRILPHPSVESATAPPNCMIAGRPPHGQPAASTAASSRTEWLLSYYIL